MKTYYLYLHTRLDTNHAFYVGIGSHTSGHYERAFDLRAGKRNSLWGKIFEQCGGHVQVSILREYDDLTRCQQDEKLLIRLLGRTCTNNGLLANIGRGGEFSAGDPRKIVQFNLNGERLHVWDDIGQAVHALHLSTAAIYACLAGSSSASHGFRWKYLHDAPEGDLPTYTDPRLVPVHQYSMTDCFIRSFPSIRHAARELQIDSSSITNVLRAKRRSAGGFHWYYERLG